MTVTRLRTVPWTDNGTTKTGNDVYATADNSSTITQSVTTQGGVYIVKFNNLSVGPVDVWTAATPQVSR
jgi:hypothetical protein